MEQSSPDVPGDPAAAGDPCSAPLTTQDPPSRSLHQALPCSPTPGLAPEQPQNKNGIPRGAGRALPGVGKESRGSAAARRDPRHRWGRRSPPAPCRSDHQPPTDSGILLLSVADHKACLSYRARSIGPQSALALALRCWERKKRGGEVNLDFFCPPLQQKNLMPSYLCREQAALSETRISPAPKGAHPQQGGGGTAAAWLQRSTKAATLAGAEEPGRLRAGEAATGQLGALLAMAVAQPAQGPSRCLNPAPAPGLHPSQTEVSGNLPLCSPGLLARRRAAYRAPRTCDRKPEQSCCAAPVRTHKRFLLPRGHGRST